MSNRINIHVSSLLVALAFAPGCMGASEDVEASGQVLSEVSSDTWRPAPAGCGDLVRQGASISRAAGADGLFAVLNHGGRVVCVGTFDDILDDATAAELARPSGDLRLLIEHVKSARIREGNPSPQPSTPGDELEGNPSPQPSTSSTPVEGNPSPQPSNPGVVVSNPSPRATTATTPVEGNPSPQPSTSSTPVEGNPSPQPSTKAASNDVDPRDGNPSPQPSSPRFA